MVRRSKNWNEGLAEDLKDRDFAKEFIMASLEEGISLQVTLGKVLRAYGVKEFAKLTKIAGPNLLRAVNPKHNPTQETLDRMLRPFSLTLAVAPIQSKKKAA